MIPVANGHSIARRINSDNSVIVIVIVIEKNLIFSDYVIRVPAVILLVENIIFMTCLCVHILLWVSF